MTHIPLINDISLRHIVSTWVLFVFLLSIFKLRKEVPRNMTIKYNEYKIYYIIHIVI